MSPAILRILCLLFLNGLFLIGLGEDDGQQCPNFDPVISKFPPAVLREKGEIETVNAYMTEHERSHPEWCKILKDNYGLTDDELPLKQTKTTSLATVLADKSITKIFMLLGQAGDGKSHIYNQMGREYLHYSGNSIGTGVPLDSDQPLVAQLSKTSAMVDTMGLFNKGDWEKSKKMVETILGAADQVYLVFSLKTKGGRYMPMPAAVVKHVLLMFKDQFKSPVFNALFTQVPGDDLKALGWDILIGYLQMLNADLKELGKNIKAASVTPFNDVYATPTFSKQRRAPLFDPAMYAWLHKECQPIKYNPMKIQPLTSKSPADLVDQAAENDKKLAALRKEIEDREAARKKEMQEELEKWKQIAESKPESNGYNGPTGWDAVAHGFGQMLGAITGGGIGRLARF